MWELAAPSRASPKNLKEKNPHIQIVGADPYGSILGGGDEILSLPCGIARMNCFLTLLASLPANTTAVEEILSFLL